MTQNLDVLGFGMAFGVMYAIFMVAIGAASWLTGYGLDVVNLMSSIYIGFGPDPAGTLIGGLWGLVDGFMIGALLAWFYNYFSGLNLDW